MKTFTVELAKKIAEDFFKKHPEKIEEDFARTHTQAVAQIAVILAKKLNLNVETVEMSAWVHDIGYIVEKKNHALHSVELLEKEGFEIAPIVRDCILNHGTDGKPESKEAKVLQMADKLSILSIPVLELLLRQEKITTDDVAFVEKMTNGAVSYLKKLSE